MEDLGIDLEQAQVGACKAGLRYTLNGLQDEFGDTPVIYAVFELLTAHLADADYDDRVNHEAFLREALEECISTADERAATLDGLTKRG